MPTPAKRKVNRAARKHKTTRTLVCRSFFIVYEPNEQCDDDTFFAALQNQDVEPEINPIRVRNRSNQDMEAAARQLFQTVKDHDNPVNAGDC